MKTRLPALFALILLTGMEASLLPAQEASPLPTRPPVPEQLVPGRPSGPRRLLVPGVPTAQPETTNVLANNYRVSLIISGVAPEKVESSVLTASRQITLNNVIPVPGDAGLLQRMEFSGFLGELGEERLELSYSINMSFPTPDAVKAIQKGVTANGVHYLNESATGTLRVTPGSSYDVLKSGNRIYTLKIEIEKERP